MRVRTHVLLTLQVLINIVQQQVLITLRYFQKKCNKCTFTTTESKTFLILFPYKDEI
jgi:hypothetical protein